MIEDMNKFQSQGVAKEPIKKTNVKEEPKMDMPEETPTEPATAPSEYPRLPVVVPVEPKGAPGAKPKDKPIVSSEPTVAPKKV
jgi:hypothetical protein